jgi:iron-sulfur cluster insertion protein
MSASAPIPLSFGDNPEEKKTVDFDHGKELDLTPAAVARVKLFLTNTPQAAGKTFRVLVEGGGCSGFQYQFTFDEKRDDDIVVDCGEASVLIDPASLEFIKGAVVDYTEDFRGSGFVVHNPQAKASCGCGISFSV